MSMRTERGSETKEFGGQWTSTKYGRRVQSSEKKSTQKSRWQV